MFVGMAISPAESTPTGTIGASMCSVGICSRNSEEDGGRVLGTSLGREWEVDGPGDDGCRWFVVDAGAGSGSGVWASAVAIPAAMGVGKLVGWSRVDQPTSPAVSRAIPASTVSSGHRRLRGRRSPVTDTR